MAYLQHVKMRNCYPRFINTFSDQLYLPAAENFIGKMPIIENTLYASEPFFWENNACSRRFKDLQIYYRSNTH